MTAGLVKLIVERNYGASKEDHIKPDLRVIHCEPQHADCITHFYENAGWEVTKEEV